MLQKATCYSLKIPLTEFSKGDDRLLYQRGVWVLESSELHLSPVQSQHWAPAAEHLEWTNKLDYLQSKLYWPKMRCKVDQFFKIYHIWQRGKPMRNTTFKNLRPLSIPDWLWADILVDFVTGLPWSNRFYLVCVLVDRLTKMQHLIPCCSTINTPEFIKHCIQNILSYTDFHSQSFSDKDSNIVANRSGTLCKQLQTAKRLSITYNLQTERQTRPINAVAEQYLRRFIN